MITSFEALSAADRFASEPEDYPSPEWRYDRNWAIAVLDRAHAQLKREYGAAGEQALFDRLPASIQGADQSQAYDVIAAELKKTKDAVMMEASRMRRRIGELLRAVVTETVDSTADAEDELRYLLRVLSV